MEGTLLPTKEQQIDLRLPSKWKQEDSEMTLIMWKENVSKPETQ